MSQTDLDPGLFDATVSSLTHSFGDRTRRAVYLYVRENPGATASALAEHCGVHPNVVRHHLERLVEGGYVVAEPVHRSTVGRPAKGYRALETAGTMEALVRRDALLVALLERALGRLGPDLAEAIAHEVGVEYGRGLSGEVSFDSTRPIKAALASIAGLLSAHGYAARAEHDGDEIVVVAETCPFGIAAQNHPMLCAVDRGLLAGMLEGVGPHRSAVTLTTRAEGADACRHRLG